MNQLQAKGIGFASVQESLDTTMSGGKLVFHLFGALAEFGERKKPGEETASVR